MINWNGETVLVTGINGYIASTTGLHLLESGYALVGTVRSKASSEALLTSTYKEYSSRVRITEVADMTVTGAFDEAVKGVSAIIHGASPVNWSLQSPDEVIAPAVNSVVSILKSALNHAGPQLKSFIFISSGATIIEPKTDPNYVFSETDWNQYSEKKVKELGLKAPGQLVYNASKVAAEKSVWRFQEDFKPPFAISSINPGTVTGPSVQPFPNGFKPNLSLEFLWGIFSGSYSSVPPKLGSGSYADVRDVADLQIWVLQNPSVSANERYLAVNGPGIPQAAADILHKAYPDRASIMPKGTPGEGYSADYSWSQGSISVSGAKAQKAMGRSWISFEQSVLDTAKYFEQFV